MRMSSFLVRRVASGSLIRGCANRLLAPSLYSQCGILSFSAKPFITKRTLYERPNLKLEEKSKPSNKHSLLEQDNLQEELPNTNTNSTPHNLGLGTALIKVVNKLQEVCSIIGTEINLPQLVVIGSQSSGKSSVIENLVGKDFLPRGSGLVTRRPLILQLTQTEGTEEWAEFGHKPNEKFTYEQLRDEISNETDRTTGKNKGISAEPIFLKIFSPNVLSLTLVDTPGIARVPIGDQPTDIEEQLRKMILSFINNPNSIILAVQAATSDLVTSDALKLAREVDPKGTRTIGVLTKLDLMDKGTDAMDILLGKVFPLQLGYVGIVNRSQQDIMNNKPVSQAIVDESEWFRTHPIYQSISSHCGTHYLAIRCNKLLTKHIRECLPEVKNQVREMTKKTEKELELYGYPVSNNKTEQGWILMDILQKFTGQFREDIEGAQQDLDTTQVTGGARINYIFSVTLPHYYQKIGALDGLTDQQIRVALRNAAGPRPALFVPEKAFELLARRQIEKLKDPSMKAAELVLDELIRIITSFDQNTLSRFYVLRDRVIEISTHVLRKCLKPTNEMINALVDIESGFINTSNPSFSALKQLTNKASTEEEEKRKKEVESKVSPDHEEEKKSGGLFGFIFGGSNQAPSGNQKPASKSSKSSDPPTVLRIEEDVTESERQQINLIKNLLSSYYDVSSRTLRDSVTKAIMHFLVNRSINVLQRELVTELYKEELFSELLRESDDVMAKRQNALRQLEILKKAKKILQVTEMKDMPLQLY